MIQRHFMAKYSRYEFRIIPEFLIEFIGQSFHRSLKSAFIRKLKIITGSSVLFLTFDNLAVDNGLRQHNPFFIVGNTGKYLVGTSLIKPDKSYPLLFIILKSHDIGIQFLRTLRRHMLRLFLMRNQHSGTGTVAINRTSFTPAFPRLHINPPYQFFRHIRRKIDGNAYGMVYPFLNLSLHPYFRHPVDIVGGRFTVRRFGHQSIEFHPRIMLGNIISLSLHPSQEFMMENHELFERISVFIHKIDTHVLVPRIHFTAAHINRHKNRLYTGSRLGHKAGSTRRSYGQTGYIATSVFQHIRI